MGEKYGMGRMEPGTSLYSSKVLIQAKCAALLPDWLRFIKGVVDSEDVPLNLSREMLQDNALISKLHRALTGRLIRFFETQAKKDRQKYLEFFAEFGNFMREGIATDDANREKVLGLMFYESSNLESDELTSLAEYVERMPDTQSEIYYLCAPERSVAEASPYLESLNQQGLEVLFMYEPVDVVVMAN